MVIKVTELIRANGLPSFITLVVFAAFLFMYLITPRYLLIFIVLFSLPGTGDICSISFEHDCVHKLAVGIFIDYLELMYKPHVTLT